MEKTLFITGATKNTGLAIAERFAKEGYHIALTSRREEDAQKAAAYLSETYGVFCKGYHLSLSDVGEIREVFADVKKAFGALDIYVGNSAHLGVGHEVMTLTEEDYDAVMNTNLKANFFCAQEAAKLMQPHHKGSIVFIGSVHAHGAIWGRSTYAASKGALRSLVNNMAFELAVDGIRVNMVSPGAIRTERWDGMTPEQEAQRRINWPAGVESTGEDIANGVFYIATDLAKTVTGTELLIDSGVCACLLNYNGGKH